MPLLPFSRPSLPKTVRHPNPHSPTRRLPLTFLTSPLPLPPSLSLEHVLSDSLCPPLSLRDFYAYLRAEERAGEVLAFVLWFRAYEVRWAGLGEGESGRAEVVDPGEEWEAYLRGRERERGEAEEVPPPTPPLDPDALAIAPFNVTPPPLTPPASERAFLAHITHLADLELAKTRALLARDDLPLRACVTSITLRFLTPSSPRALSSPHLPAVLLALRRTTHPSAFRPLYDDLLSHLALVSHPAFVRACIPNARPPLLRALLLVTLCLYLGSGLAAGLACVLVPRVARAWRLCSVPLVWLGVGATLCVLSGVCPILYGMGRRQLQLWEVMRNCPPSPLPSSPSDALSSSAYATDGEIDGEIDSPPPPRTRSEKWFAALFGDTVREHPALREMQDGVVLRAVGLGAVGAVLWGAVIMSVPGRS